MRKLGVKSMAGLVRCAIRNRLLEGRAVARESPSSEFRVLPRRTDCMKRYGPRARDVARWVMLGVCRRSGMLWLSFAAMLAVAGAPDAFAQERLASYKRPATIEFTSEMPRDPSGKLYKRKLRDPHWEGVQRQI